MIINENNMEYLHYFYCHSLGMNTREASSSLIWLILYDEETYTNSKQELCHPKAFIFWHDHLCQPKSIMMRSIIENSHEHH